MYKKKMEQLEVQLTFSECFSVWGAVGRFSVELEGGKPIFSSRQCHQKYHSVWNCIWFAYVNILNVFYLTGIGKWNA